MMCAPMQCLKTGQFRGETYRARRFGGVIATETEYDYRFIEWHWHENPYFSLTTFGVCRDINRREAFVCGTDSLLFLNAGEPHSNEKSDAITRGFQIEIDRDWISDIGFNLDELPRTAIVGSPGIKTAVYNVYKEARLADGVSALSVEAIVIDMLSQFRGDKIREERGMPSWTRLVEEMLRELTDEKLTLDALASELGLHRAHISRSFPRYFNCTFGEYIRRRRIEKSVRLLRDSSRSLTEIAMECGFSDQSHFIRTFKTIHRITPKEFRRLIGPR